MEKDREEQIEKLLRRHLLTAAETVMILLDLDGRILGWLGAAQTVFGHTPAEAHGRRHAMLFTPEDQALGEAIKELQIARKGVPAEDDRWLERKDGSRFWATGVLEPIYDEDEQLIGFAKVLRNRTDLRGLIDGLEIRVQSLEESGDRKNSFISTLAHELRNPLDSLVNAIHVLRLSDSQTENQEFALSAAERQVASMRRMIDDLLDVTRISTGKLKLVLRQEPLNEIIAAAGSACQPLVDERGQRLHLFLGTSATTVQADAVRLQQVFINLIQNAAKYTQRGGNIWVKLLVEGREAAIKVEDDGTGIAPDLLPRIFDLFTQADAAATEARGGLGIGLSVVRDLTRLHGGTVQVRSDGLGKGSEFVVRLPLSDTSQKATDSPHAVEPCDASRSRNR
jgi:PAS domain S-box-containing protein